MSRGSLVLFVAIVVLFSTTTQGQECGPNQNFITCGSPCPPLCNDSNPACTLHCIYGCQCKNGFLLNSRSECVPPSQC
ncbi:chymotrypsin inhibitor-like isoform X1 [Harpegnathos saltator]|uniref:chymotrypsin inhibitor-like isoform X1 n=1 Tax=Harpegnathos saltator TaxID=610380 RepID=UPI000DBED379|nr:chymotrypsin inhibitor-like isoform X1 [Harpegnathos saltator]